MENFVTAAPPCATIGSGSLMSRKVLKSSSPPSSSSPSSSSSSTSTTTILNAGALLSIIKFFTEAMLDYKLKGKSIPLLDILDTIKLADPKNDSGYDESKFRNFDPIDKESEILVTSFLLLEMYPLCSTTTTNNNNNKKKTSDDSNDDDDHIVEETISDLNLDINAYVALDRDMRTGRNHYAAKAGSALYRAIELGHYDVATYLVEMGANLNQERDTGFISSPVDVSYLHDVCQSKGTVRKGNFERRREFVKYLIQDKNASFLLEELCEFNRSTPLQIAVSYRAAGQHHDIHLVRMFLDHLTTPGHVHCNIADRRGETALHLLCGCPKKTDFHFEAARLLVEHGGNIEQKTPAGNTPLAAACLTLWNLQEDDEKMHFDFIKMMINELGANPNCIPYEFTDCMNPKGKTLLHYACISNFNFVQLLLENGADPDIADNDGDRPVDCAKQDGYNDIVALLQRFSDTAE